ncbi:MAG: hypothetical protein AAFR37_12620, partial [Cyanobacteria bacterium J06628_3]
SYLFLYFFKFLLIIYVKIGSNLLILHLSMLLWWKSCNLPVIGIIFEFKARSQDNKVINWS